MFPSVALALPLVLAAATASIGRAFVPPPISCSRHCSLALSDDAWAGEVVSNDPEGRIRGCQLQNVGDSPTDWKISIDGDQADLGKFSEAIYKKITQDAKQQRYVDVVCIGMMFRDMFRFVLPSNNPGSNASPNRRLVSHVSPQVPRLQAGDYPPSSSAHVYRVCDG